MGEQTCPNCGTANPERARFCMSCGWALAQRCGVCGTENPPSARFCIECGNALAAGQPAGAGPAAAPDPAAPSEVAADAATTPAAKASTEASVHSVPRSAQSPATAPPAAKAEPPPEERRNASVLFADLSGYTAVAERMDPEAVKSMIDDSLGRLAGEVERFGGHVDKFIGDNVMAIFGAPIAHEDDPERAVRAGLAMQDAMEEINAAVADTAGASFALRVGINSGEVLAGRIGEGYTVIGDTVNVAARLQAAADPGSVTVGESTWRPTRDAIAYEELAPLRLKGKAEPVPAWQALSVAGPDAPTRASRAATPLVGRDDESTLLASLYQRTVAESRPHLVTLIGQPGVGKSRLLRELAAGLGARSEAPILRAGRCPPYAGTAYWALGEIIRDQFEILDADDSGVAWRKLLLGVGELSEIEEPAQRVAAALALPLGIEPPPDVSATTTAHAVTGATAELDSEAAQQVRDRLFSAVRSLIEAVSRLRPLVLTVEDAHWADEGMLDLIEHLARWVRGPALIVCAAREELLDRRPGWGGGRRNATTISLAPLPAPEVEAMVAGLLAASNGDAASNGGTRAELARRVAERSGGNPLFAEELVNRILEEGGDETGTLPESVQSVLAARLDALPKNERALLQQAAVVGERFWEGSMTTVASEQGIDLAEVLDSLQERELIAPSAGSRLAGEREYAFKHALIRDVAYERLPKALRARRHAEVGRFIQGRAGERGDAVVALVAEHAARAAGLGTEANLPAQELEEIRTSALGHLEAAGDSAAALHSNQAALGHYTTALELEGIPEDAEARIGEKEGDVALRLGRIDVAIEIWERCLDYRRRREDLTRVGDLHRRIGAALWQKGERTEAIAHYQQGIDLLKDGPPCMELVRLYEEAASLYMHTGDNMLAIYASEKALRLAASLDEPGAASRAHGIFGRVFGRIGDADKALENLERSVDLARRSDPREAVRALLTLGSHLELSESSSPPSDAYSEALELAEQVGDIPAQVELHAALARLSAHSGDWAAAERGAEASSALVEREGLIGMLCFPELIRGWLSWRDGRLDEAVETLRSACELGESAGRMEIVLPAFLLLGWVLSGRGDHEGADAAFVSALEVCERAGMTAQSVEASAARAVNLAVGGRLEEARSAAEEAEQLAKRLPDSFGNAAILDATGAVDDDPASGAATLSRARDAWREAGRPLEAARSEMLRAWQLARADDPGAPAARDAAISAFEQSGFAHLADRVRALVG